MTATTTNLETLLTRIASVEERLNIEPPPARPIDSSTWDAVQLRLAALEDILLTAENQPEPDHVADAALEAEYVAWRRVNGFSEPSLTMRLDVVAFTRHFANTRHMGQGVAA